jgi:integrase
MANDRAKVEKGIYRTAAGTYEATARGSAGHQMSATFVRLVDARAWRAHVLVQKQKGLLPIRPVKRQRFEDVAEGYLRDHRDLERRTRDRYRSSLDVHLLPEFGRIYVERITSEQIQDWVWRMRDAGYAPETVRGHFNLLAAIMARSLRGGRIVTSPCTGVELPKRIKKSRRVLTEVELDRLVEAMPPRYKATVYLGAYMGLRFQEVAGLREDALDLGASPPILKVKRTVKRSNGRCWVADYGKSKSAMRELPLPGFLQADLQTHLAAHPMDGWIFPSPTGGFLRYDNFRSRVWEPAVARAGLAGVTFHDLRHTTVPLLISEGAHLFEAQGWIGHSSIRVTYDTYGHLVSGRYANLADRLHERRQPFIS